MGADSETEDAQRVLQWIGRERRPEFKRWQIFQDVRSQGRFQKAADLDPALDRLVEHRFIRVKLMPERQGPGRRANPVYEVNPQFLEGGNHPVNPVNPENSNSEANLQDSQDLQDGSRGSKNVDWSKYQ
jgi:hypothetical protein